MEVERVDPVHAAGQVVEERATTEVKVVRCRPCQGYFPASFFRR